MHESLSTSPKCPVGNGQWRNPDWSPGYGYLPHSNCTHKGSYRTGASYKQVDRGRRIHSGDLERAGQEHASNSYHSQVEAMVQRRRAIKVFSTLLSRLAGHVIECKR